MICTQCNNILGGFIPTAVSHLEHCTEKDKAKELMSGLSEVPIPGGFGAAGAPNDSWHQAMHSITKSYLRVAVQWGEYPMLRRRMDQLQMGLQANPSTQRAGSIIWIYVCIYWYIYIYIYIYENNTIC